MMGKHGLMAIMIMIEGLQTSAIFTTFSLRGLCSRESPLRALLKVSYISIVSAGFIQKDRYWVQLMMVEKLKKIHPQSTILYVSGMDWKVRRLTHALLALNPYDF